MTNSKRSRTAQGVAAERTVLAEMGVLADPFARGMLTASMAAACSILRHLPRVREASVTLAGLAARVLWFDAQVASALDAGIEQIVVVGAGYDSRAWRLRRDRDRFFEVDHPTTQQDKLRRAPGPGPVYVAADLRTESAMKALSSGGLDTSRPALFVVEGVTMYLTEEVVRRHLGEMAQSSAIGSRLAVDFLPPRQGETSTSRRQRRIQRLARAGSGETFKLLVEPAQVVKLVTTSYWRVDEVTTMHDAALALVPQSAHLRTEAVSDQKTMVAAVIPGPTT